MLASALMLSCMLGGGGSVVINEFAYDDSRTDDREYVELYNATDKPIDISGWLLASEDPFGPNKSFTVPANTTLQARGFYVMGSAKVPNVNQVVGTTNIWENSNESLTLKDKAGNVVDTLVYEVNKGLWPTAKPEGEGIWGNFFSVDNVETSWSRVRDGFDTNNNRDFRIAPWTPGKSNNLPAGGYCDTFDARVVESKLTAFGASFNPPHVIDPTKASVSNPNAIPASPQGGKAAIFWDSAGGGNNNMLLRDAVKDIIVEAYVYFDAKLENTGQREVWTLGVQGHTGTFYNFPDPSGAAGFLANGNTGVGWTYEVTDKAATLYLVDHNDGGRGTKAKTDRKVLGTPIVLKAGQTDGWKRLRLEVRGTTATGFFGGTFGRPNGTKVTGTISAPAVGGVYVGYREFIVTNATARPFTCDRLQIMPAAAVETFGVAVGTKNLVPVIGTDNPPFTGTTFNVTGSSLVRTRNNPSLTVLGFSRLANPLDLALLGGQTGSKLLVAPDIVFVFGNDGSGTTKLPIVVPNDDCLSGAQLHFEILDFDANLSVPFKFGNSKGLTTIIGK